MNNLKKLFLVFSIVGCGSASLADPIADDCMGQVLNYVVQDFNKLNYVALEQTKLATQSPFEVTGSACTKNPAQLRDKVELAGRRAADRKCYPFQSKQQFGFDFIDYEIAHTCGTAKADFICVTK